MPCRRSGARRRPQGNLKSDGKQVVKVEQEIVYIEPADPQVIYVPQYNPTTVVTYGAPYWGYYPTPYPSYYYPYPPGAALATGVIWGAAIGAAWGGNRYGCCGDANINVNRNTNINTGNINRGTGARQQPAGGSALEVEQAARPGQQLGRQDGLVRSRGRQSGGRGRWGWTAVIAARRRWRRGRTGADRGQRVGRRCSPARAVRRRRIGRRKRHSQRRVGQRDVGIRLGVRKADADGQLARGIEPQFDVRRGRGRRSSYGGGGGGARGGGGGGGGGGRGGGGGGRR